MNNKDLFNAINDAAEEFAPEVWESTESERPVILRAEKKPRSAKRIAIGAAACTAAAVVIGAAVTVGVNDYRQRVSPVSNSSDSLSAEESGRNFAPLSDILRIRDVGFYRKDLRDEMVREVEEWYVRPMSKEDFSQLVAMDYVPPQPQVYYYNDVPLDVRMLSNEAYGWLSRYCLLSEEDRADEIVPDEVRYLAEDGFVRYGDLGFLRGKYTDEQLEEIKEYMVRPFPRQLSSVMSPAPDVYYYDDIPYNLDRLYTDNAKSWLSWFCWLDEETQEALSGYVPEEMRGVIQICNSEKPEEIVTYRGRMLDVRSVSHDTELFIKWYNSLSGELQAKVGYEPDELSSERLENFPDAELVPELIGADGVKLTYADLADAVIYKFRDKDHRCGLEQLSFGDIDEWDEIRIYGFTYLAEPGSDKFKRYNVGDPVGNGLSVMSGCAVFRRIEGVSDPALYYVGGDVMFSGTATVDMLVVENNGNGWMICAVSGLPAVSTDDDARAEGRIVPKEHSAAEFEPDALIMPYSIRYSGTVYGDDEQIALLREKSGQILTGVEITDIRISFHDGDELIMPYELVAYLPHEGSLEE